MNKLYQVMDQPAAAMPTDDNRQFLHTSQAGVVVPLLQSVVIGLMVFVFVLMIGWNWLDPWKVSALAGMAASIGWFIFSMKRWTELTRPMIRISSVDDDNNPATQNVIRVQLDRVTDTGHYQQTSIFDLPQGVTEQMMADLANGILNMHRPFTEGEWCGTGKTFSMPKFRQLRTLLENRKLTEPVNEKDKRQGIRFNSDGEQFLQGFLA